MRTKAAVSALTTLAVLLVTSPAFASPTVVPDEPPPSDNGKWVGVVAFFVFVAVVGGMLFIANAYRKNNQNSPR